MHLSMLCPTTPHLGAFGVIMGELTKKFRPIQGHLTLSRTIHICDEYGFRTRGYKFNAIEQAIKSLEIQVLVQIGPHSRVLRIESQCELVPTICRSFANVPRVVNACKLLVQIKDEDWSGEFVDLKEDQVVPDRSVLNVIPQVGFLIF